MTELVYFNESKIELQKEMREHPELLNQIAAAELTDWSDQLALVAAYCGIILDGYYLEDQIMRLEDMLFFKLRAKRMIRI